MKESVKLASSMEVRQRIDVENALGPRQSIAVKRSYDGKREIQETCGSQLREDKKNMVTLEVTSALK